jgi:hypothetical protein
MAKSETKTSEEIAKPQSTLDRLRNGAQGLKAARDMDWDALLQSLDAEGKVVDVSQLGDGFHLLQGVDDKKKLIGQPLVVLDWDINPGKFGGFATLHIKTQHPIVFNGTGYNHFILNDGGSGIGRQIFDFNANGGDGVIVCRRGLRVSEDYEVMQPDPENPGKKIPVIDPATGKPVLGTTFYLDTSL